VYLLPSLKIAPLPLIVKKGSLLFRSSYSKE
jgi:hypothetical protein